MLPSALIPIEELRWSLGEDDYDTEPEMLPSALTPIEELRRPLGEDDYDAEPVKQLIGMGFSRTQAVDALERNNYDFQDALDSLLGAL
jgi:epidermal growth factor receptor substrate 15